LLCRRDGTHRASCVRLCARIRWHIDAPGVCRMRPGRENFKQHVHMISVCLYAALRVRAHAGFCEEPTCRGECLRAWTNAESGKTRSQTVSVEIVLRGRLPARPPRERLRRASRIVTHFSTFCFPPLPLTYRILNQVWNGMRKEERRVATKCFGKHQANRRRHVLPTQGLLASKQCFWAKCVAFSFALERLLAMVPTCEMMQSETAGGGRT